VTQPAAASKNKYGARIYAVPRPGSLEIEELPSISQILGVIGKPGLERWKRWKLAQALALRPDWVALAGSGEIVKGIRSGAKDAVKQADDADQGASNAGTSIHYWAEGVDDKSILWEMVPEPIKPAVERYCQAKLDYGWETVKCGDRDLAETTCYSFTYGYAGTPDRFMRFPKISSKSHVGDLKTGQDVHDDYALQMACAAFSDGLWVPGPTPLSDAAMEQLQKDISAGVNIPPTATGRARTKWSQAAIKSAEAELQESFWDEYAKSGQHLPLPDDLCQDTAFILHVTNEIFELVPLTITGLRPAIAGLSALHAFSQNKMIVGDPVPKPGSDATVATTAQVAESSDPLQAKAASQGIKIVSAEDAKNILAKAEAAGTAIPEPTEDDLPPAIDDFQPGPPEQIPVAPEAPRPLRVQVYRDRIAALSPDAKQKLAFNWPDGVPTLKQSDNQTEEQLAQIDKILWDIESEFPPSAQETDAALGRLSNAFGA
jgi:hypothetical protein